MVFENHNFNALYLPLETPIIVGRVKCCGMEDRAGRVNGGTIVLCRERTERSRTIPSFRKKKTNA